MDAEDWNQRFSSDGMPEHVDPSPWLETYVAHLPPGRAVDFGCGSGGNAVWLASRGWSVTGVDFSSEALLLASRLAERVGVRVEWIEADVCEWEPPVGGYELAISCYLHLPAGHR
ncbi:MAG TPA: class I SAM-dependent methyltransferase, partial [Acidimicrobiales bacterium]|nr:class I SAM-dependent methyltransferase [Acidimicrobiales bacterium]